jgi:hypothetical protein
MHRVKGMAPYLLVMSCLLLASAISLKATRQGEGSQQVSTSSAPVALDFEYFKTKVEPIFLAKRPGHARCVSCHSSNNAPLRLVPLSPRARSWDEEQSRKNFQLVKRVAIPGDLESPLLIHPLTEEAGGDFFHNGGKHFNSKSDPEWLTLKAFILGETVK